MNDDYYQLLDVPSDADIEEIRFAFRKLAKTIHPDVSDNPATADLFKRVSNAYDVLSDSAKRAKYDALLKVNQQQAPRTCKPYPMKEPKIHGLVSAISMDDENLLKSSICCFNLHNSLENIVDLVDVVKKEIVEQDAGMVNDLLFSDGMLVYANEKGVFDALSKKQLNSQWHRPRFLCEHDGIVYCGAQDAKLKNHIISLNPEVSIGARKSEVKGIVSHNDCLYDVDDKGNIFVTLTGRIASKGTPCVYRSFASNKGILYDLRDGALFETLQNKRIGEAGMLVSHEGTLYSTGMRAGVYHVQDVFADKCVARRNNQINGFFVHDDILYDFNVSVYDTLKDHAGENPLWLPGITTIIQNVISIPPKYRKKLASMPKQ